MTGDLIVIMGATQDHGTMAEYRRQLAAAGIDVHIVDPSGKPNINGGGNLGYRVNAFRSLAQQFSHYERIIFSDAFDVLFFGSREDVIRKIPMTHLLHAGEKNCYPLESLTLPIPDRGPWRYANGGLVAGTPEHFLHWCCYTERHPQYNPQCLDQYFLNLQVSEGIGCLPDYRTELFFCLYGGYDELAFKDGLPMNTLYGTRPQFIHANGRWTADEMFDRWRKSLP